MLVQLGDIGDVVLATPTIRAIKETHPHARLSVLVRKPYGSLLSADPNLGEVVETASIRGTVFHVIREYVRLARRLRQAQYDLVIDVRTGDRGAILSFLTGAACRVGRHGDEKPFWHDLLFTKIIRDPPVGPPTVHPGADQSLRVVREIGIDTADSIPRLYVSPADHARAIELLAELRLSPDERWVTINPFSRWKYKEWDSSKWKELIERVWEEHGLPVVLIGSQEDVAGCVDIVATARGRTLTLAGRTTLGELAAVIAMSTLHVGVDSAAPHIAAALGTPTVTIHGPTDWRAWRVVSDLHKIVTPTPNYVPRHRMGRDDTHQSRRLDLLGSETVLQTVDEVLRNLLRRSG
ncbi:MAG TPA: glycosyltransferase family 9 protein [Burkholderiales bacterium]|nr:glycosyltransferase family 9 protein [Burkholderiales bacterium]